MGIRLKRKQYIAFLAVISCILIFIAGWRLKVINSPDTRQQTAGENYAADLEDGSYTPDKFGFTGGTGRVELSCPEVVVRDGKAYTSLIFDSGSYSYVKIDGETYEGSNTEDTSAFEIPVRLNQNNTVVGCTTKMSSNHEITYSVFVYLEEADDGSSLGESGDEAPKIAGLTFKDEKKAENAEHYRIFRYEEGITCIETKPGISDDEVIRYLIVPSDAEIPAGLEKEMVVIRRPGREDGEESFHAYVASGPVLCWMDDQEQLGNLALTGIKEDCPAENVRKLEEEGKIIFGGSYDDIDYKLLVKEQCDLAVMPADILAAEDGEEAGGPTEARQEKYRETAGYCMELGIPIFVDLASKEKTREGQEEWKDVYEIIFDSENVENAGGGEGEGEVSDAPRIEGLTCESVLEPEYAENFHIYYYSDDFKVIEAEGSLTYLVVPEGAEVPDELPEGMTVLQSPFDQIYVAGTATMAMFHALDGLSAVRFSGLQADDWYVDAAREAMEAGEIKFAGKYSEPDYEMLVDEGCDLAVESQMIHHTPKILELLQMMDIPVLIDCSSNESHPLGRVEWIKVYGALLGREEEAEDFFEEQTKVLDELEGIENTGKSVVYFYINTGGQAVVRTGTDYIAKMIEIAGGNYPFDSLTDKGGTAAVTMEEFYAAAADADYLIYNASIDNKLNSIEELTAKDEVLGDIKAVKEGNVFCTDKDFYQASDIAARMITDIHIILTDGDEDEMTFLSRVKE